MELLDPVKFSLCSYFFSGHLAVRVDNINFPSNQPDIFKRYENLLRSALQTLCLSKEELRARSEFNFDSGSSISLETAVAVLRVVVTLRDRNFQKITLIAPKKDTPAADIFCEKNAQRVCVEVKTISKQGMGKGDLFIEEKLYEKLLEIVGKAKKQLCATAAEMYCSVKIFACVVNWFDQSIYLSQSDYQQILDKLESHPTLETLVGVEGILFVTKMGEHFLFLNEQGRLID